jgi:hypothetical protein
MHTTVQDKTTTTTQKLTAIRENLPFEVEQAWIPSEFYIASYLNEHTAVQAKDGEDGAEAGDEGESDTSSADTTALMAAGRLEWLLQETRPSLSGQLSEWDITTLLDCYQGQIFSPDNFECVASGLCDHLGVQVGFYETSDIALLVDKLLGLNRMETVTLADALEQTWHRGMKQENMSPKEFLATLGIDLT